MGTVYSTLVKKCNHRNAIIIMRMIKLQQIFETGVIISGGVHWTFWTYGGSATACAACPRRFSHFCGYAEQMISLHT